METTRKLAGINMTEASNARVAIYLDIDSLIPQVEYRGATEINPKDFFTASNTGEYLKEIEDYARGFGEIVLWEAVGLWSPDSRHHAARLLSRRGALLRHMPTFLEHEANGKNAADILLAARIMDAVREARLDVIVLGANDKDFEPLAQELKRLGKVIVAVSPPASGAFQQELLEWAFDDWKELTVPQAWVAAESGGDAAQKYLDDHDKALAKLSIAAAEQARPAETELAVTQQVDLEVVANHFFNNWSEPQTLESVINLFVRFWIVRMPEALEAQYRERLAVRFLSSMTTAGGLNRTDDGQWSLDGDTPRESWVEMATRKLWGAEQHICAARPELIGLEQADDEPTRLSRASGHVKRLFKPLPPAIQNRATTEALVEQLCPTGTALGEGHITPGEL